MVLAIRDVAIMTENVVALSTLKSRLKTAPIKPGVYIFTHNNKVLYIGKAVNLRNRLRTYFYHKDKLHYKVKTLMSKVSNFEFIVTESGDEALLLESTLIKKHKPPFNIRLKDDKTYPFIKIDTTETFPRVYITRHVTNDGAKYFGPYASAHSIRKTLKLLKKLFPYRSCTKTITGKDPHPCLDYHINRCVGPCIGAVDQIGYGKVIDQVSLFLRGKTSAVKKQISTQMNYAADNLDFEKAATLRDQIQSIEQVNTIQKVSNINKESIDVLGLAKENSEAWIEIFTIREGKMVGREHFLMSGVKGSSDSNIIQAFIEQFYSSNPFVPSSIVSGFVIEDIELTRSWLQHKRGAKVQISVPVRGTKHKLVQMAQNNAVEGLKQKRLSVDPKANFEEGIGELQEFLSLPHPPYRIECYDISNTQGTSPVGSMVVFENGKPKKSDYRKFIIKSVEGIDDYSMMKEMLSRRFRHFQKTNVNDSLPLNKIDLKTDKWKFIPDLVLIDGGKGHLGTAIQVLLELGIDEIPLASLAKEEEELFIPENPDPIVLPRNSKALFLVQRARDEAHRFAVTFHRNRRSIKSISSTLDKIAGIGPKRRSLLLKTFGSTAGIKKASIEEISSLNGFSVKVATQIKQNL